MSSAPTHTPRQRPTTADFTSFAVSVRRMQRLSVNFVRVTLGGSELVNFHTAGFDQRVKLIFPIDGSGLRTFPRGGSDWHSGWRELSDSERCPMRTYTVRASRPSVREIDIDFVVHGDSGPATRWVDRATIGDELLIIGPDARTLLQGHGPVGGVEFRSRNARRILLAGDETAAPAICSIVESLPTDARGQVFLEIGEEADVLPLATPPGISVSWLPRDRRPTLGHGEVLARAVRAWASEMIVSDGDDMESPRDTNADTDTDTDTDADTDADVGAQLLWDVPNPVPPGNEKLDLYAWIAGEAGCVKELRRFLVRDVGMHRDDVAFMGYWRSGRVEN